MRPYASRGIPFVVYRYPVVADGSPDKVFVIPYRGSDAVACVTNDPKIARQVHTTLAAVGLSYEPLESEEDSISYWEHAIDTPCAPAVKRLDVFIQGLNLHDGAEAAQKALEDVERKEKKLFEPSEGPLGRMIRENEKITIMPMIIDCSVPLDRPPHGAAAELSAASAEGELGGTAQPQQSPMPEGGPAEVGDSKGAAPAP